MNDFTTPIGFWKTYFQLLPYSNTAIEAFNALNNFHFTVFGFFKYNDYNDFKRKIKNPNKNEHLSGEMQQLARLLEKNKSTEPFTYLNGIERLKITLGESNTLSFNIDEKDILPTTEVYKKFIDKIFLTTIYKN